MKYALIYRILLPLCLISSLCAQSKGGRWQFENDSTDTADWDQRDDSGHLTGDAHFSDNVPLAEGDAYLCLDSLNAHDFFEVEDSGDLDFENENIGISLWIKPSVINENDVHFILNKGVQDAIPKTTNYALRISKAKKLEFLIRDSNNQAQTVSSSFTITEGEWIFIAVFYDYSKKLVNMWQGPQTAPCDTLAFDQDFFPNNDPLVIGSWHRNDPESPSIQDFEGSIDDVRISGRLEDILPVVSGIHTYDLPPFNALQESVDIFPNPVSISAGRGQTQFKIHANGTNPVSYTIYNILGQQIYRGNAGKLPGVKNIQWGLKDNWGRQIRSGLYFIKFEGLQQQLVKKIIVIK